MGQQLNASRDSYIFISYSRKNRTFCIQLAEDLQRAGLKIWIDAEIPGGKAWDQEVTSALSGADAVLIILSPDAVRSENVLNEISFALEKARRVIPILYRPCDVPLNLHRLQHIDFSTDYEAALERLLPHLQPAPRTAAEEKIDTVVETVVACDVVDRMGLVEKLGDGAAAEILHRYDQMARDLAAEHGPKETDSNDRLLLLFERPHLAALFALDLHRAIREQEPFASAGFAARIGIHLGEIVVRKNPPEAVRRGAKPLEIEGLAKAMALRLAALAQGGQTLLSQGAFDIARRSMHGNDRREELRWLAHGAYVLAGMSDPTLVFEVGLKGSGPLAAPADSTAGRRLTEQATLPGWRPAPGQALPNRRHWVLEEKLGEGGFGEVWLAAHRKTGERHVFKFCYEATRLRSLQREITLFRLLKEELGERDDITRILDWNFDEAPYFLESEYTAGGSLTSWAEEQGGLKAVLLETRLEILAQIAEALGAANSVGVLHTDVKPGNVLVTTDAEGRPHAQLTDFGIGRVVDREKLGTAGFTVLGMTERTEETGSLSGTRLYMAPEVVEGKAPSVEADVYALGVCLYQLVIGDFSHALAPGWERDVDDELLREDIARAVEGSPERRLGKARRLAENLRRLEERRAERAAERREAEEAERIRAAFERSRRRRKVVAAVVAALALFAVALAFQERRTYREALRADREAEIARQVKGFMVEYFQVLDPLEPGEPALWAAHADQVTLRELLGRGGRNVEERLQDPRVRAEWMDVMGSVYRGLGDYEEAERLIEGALDIRERELDDDHPDRAASLHSLAKLRHHQGEYAAATKLFKEAFELRVRLRGAESPEAVETRFGLAQVLLSSGKFPEAAEMLRQVASLQEKLFGPEDLRLTESRFYLAYCLSRKGDTEEAEALHEAVLEKRRERLGDDHPLVAYSLDGLAVVRLNQNRSEEAARLFQQALDLRREQLDPDHPLVFMSLNNVGYSLLGQGDFAQAEAVLRQALDLKIGKLGDRHPSVASTQQNLAGVLDGLGDYRAAEQLLRQAVGILDESEQHADLAGAQTSLARVLHRQQEYGEAEDLYQQALKTFQDKLPDQPLYSAYPLLGLGELLMDRGVPSGAKPHLHRALEIRRAAYKDEESPERCEAESALGACLAGLEEFGEARELLEHAYPCLEKTRGPEHRWTLKARTRLEDLYQALGETEKIAELKNAADTE